MGACIKYAPKQFDKYVRSCLLFMKRHEVWSSVIHVCISMNQNNVKGMIINIYMVVSFIRGTCT